MSAIVKALRTGVLEVWWWVSRVARYGRRHKWQAFLVAVAGIASWHWDLWWPWVPLIMLVPMVVLLVWERCWPVGFQVQVSDRLFRRRTGKWVRRNWVKMMEASGLARKLPSNAAPQVPALRKLWWENDQLVVRPRLLTGQTLDDVAQASERLRVSLHARRHRVLPDGTLSQCRMVWSFGDPLAAAFARDVPREDARIDLEWMELGRTEDGQAWRFPLRVSSLTAGSTGSGKGSVLWGSLLSLAPAIRAGFVQACGVDLKGGMELALGLGMFTRCATTPLEAVILLEEAAATCTARAKGLAGHVRFHTPTLEEPLVVIFIDELASLIAYQSDRDLLKRAEAALSVLLSVGRAPGFYVHAYLQDPRKETVKMRHLFTQSMGLRLRDKEEAAMVLGDGAVAAGAMCHRIPRSTPGVGYAVGEDGQIVKVRAAAVTDDVIRETAARFPAARQIPIDLSAAETAERAPRQRRSRSRKRTVAEQVDVNEPDGSAA